MSHATCGLTPTYSPLLVARVLTNGKCPQHLFGISSKRKVKTALVALV